MLKSFVNNSFLVSSNDNVDNLIPECIFNGLHFSRSSYFKYLNYSQQVDIAYFKGEPFVFASNDSSKIKGIEADLLQVISRALNITMIHHEFEWDNSSDLLENLQDLLKCHDLVYGGLIWGPTSDISFTLAYEVYIDSQQF